MQSEANVPEKQRTGKTLKCEALVSRIWKKSFTEIITKSQTTLPLLIQTFVW